MKNKSLLYDSSDDSSVDEMLSEVKVEVDPINDPYSMLQQNEKTYNRISANLPIDEQSRYLKKPEGRRIEEVFIADAKWNQIHHLKKCDKRKKNHNDIPWKTNETKAPEASESERKLYLHGRQNRTWNPTLGDKVLDATNIWHNVINIKDHLGRSWVLPPLRMEPKPNLECCLPTTKIHQFKYHTSCVTNVQMFPVYGHLILSSSMDSTVKIWSLFGDRQCIQTYMGHVQGVKDVHFSRDGTQFYSTGYDQRLNLWDSDKGTKITGALLESIPSQIAISHSSESEDLFVSMNNGRIAQYDLRIGGIEAQSPIQAYQGSKSACLSICFLPGSKFFVSTYEDLSIILWEKGNTTPICSLKDNWMTPISNVVAHPKLNSVVGQMQKKEIVVINVSNGISIDTQRSFFGHSTDSVPCRMSVSPDGQYVASGDKDGSLYIWNWKTTKLVKTFKLHDDVVTKAQWSPYDASQIVTSSHDNTICLYE